MGCFALALATALIPWVSAELMVLSLPAFAGSRGVLFVLLLIATAGHMTGKSALYWAGRNGGRVLPGRAARAVQKWQARLEARSSRAAAVLVLASAVTGLPPFYAIALAAGAMKMDFLLFLAAGTTGRLVRFGCLVLLPQFAHEVMS
jgi:membrane protein YqaA with SNARE-associated domain